MEEGDADWKRAHLIEWEWCGGERHRLGEGALDRVGMSEGRQRLGEGALDRVEMVLRREMNTG